MKEESKMLQQCVVGWFIGLVTGVLMVLFWKVAFLILLASVFVTAFIYTLIK